MYCSKMKRRRSYSLSPTDYKKRRLLAAQNILAAQKRRRTNYRYSGLLGIEHKFLDVSIPATNMTTTFTCYDPSTVNCINAVVQGDGATQRDGRSYIIDSVLVQGEIEVGATSTTNGPGSCSDRVCKIALVLDRQTNGTQMNGNLVYADSTDINDVYTFRRLDQMKRYKVLRSKTIKFPVSLGAVTYLNGLGIEQQDTYPMKVPFSFIYKFKKPIKVNCGDATSGAVSNIVDNSLHIIGVTGPLGASQHISINYYARIRFRG